MHDSTFALCYDSGKGDMDLSIFIVDGGAMLGKLPQST